LGASRGIEDPVEREARRRSDDALADRVESIGTDAFLDEWLARDMFASLPDDPLERGSRSVDATGLAGSLRRAGAGTQRWLATELPSLAMPTLALAGDLDVKFRLEATAIAESVVDGRAEFVADAHHAAHLEQPERCAALVERFTHPL
jgi:pimeloyl-ACP methyl ester carboxylesterase